MHTNTVVCIAIDIPMSKLLSYVPVAINDNKK